MAFYFTQLYGLYLQNKNVYLFKISVSLEISGFARPTIKMVANFLMLLQRIWSQFKIRGFLKEIAPRTKKLMIFEPFYAKF